MLLGTAGKILFCLLINVLFICYAFSFFFFRFLSWIKKLCWTIAHIRNYFWKGCILVECVAVTFSCLVSCFKTILQVTEQYNQTHFPPPTRLQNLKEESITIEAKSTFFVKDLNRVHFCKVWTTTVHNYHKVSRHFLHTAPTSHGSGQAVMVAAFSGFERG